MSDLARHLLKRIVADPRLAYYFDPLTRSMELLTEAHAAEQGIDLELFRKTYYAQLKFVPPVKRSDLLEVLCLAVETIRLFHGEAGWEIYEAKSPEMQRINAAMADAKRHP
jgi:hypothetical protein